MLCQAALLDLLANLSLEKKFAQSCQNSAVFTSLSVLASGTEPLLSARARYTGDPKWDRFLYLISLFHTLLTYNIVVSYI